MIAHSNQPGALGGGETGGNLLVECCNLIQEGEEGDEDCSTTVGDLVFPQQACDFLGIAFGKFMIQFIILVFFISQSYPLTLDLLSVVSVSSNANVLEW